MEEFKRLEEVVLEEAVRSSMKGTRELRVDEYLALCALLNVDPRAASEGTQ